MSRTFKTLTQPVGDSGDYELVRDWLHEGLALRCPAGIPNQYCEIMRESYPDENPIYQTILDAVTGDVLLLGGGINLFAKSIIGLFEIGIIDTVEIQQDVVNLMEQGLFDNIFVADANNYIPVQNYDTIVQDVIAVDTPETEAQRLALASHYAQYLNAGGNYYEVTF